MKKISVYLLLCVMSVVCAACTKGSSEKNVTDKATQIEKASEPQITGTEISKEQPSETKEQSETKTENSTEYKLHTVESLEDDGKEMSAAEAIRSTMKGRRSALELLEKDRVFDLQSNNHADDKSNEGLERVNMLDYNRWGISGTICPNGTKWERFVCVDLDGNGTKEVIAEGGTHIILHFMGGEVYMTNIYSKVSPDKVYENGVWGTATGAFDRQLYRLHPAEGAIYRENLTYEYITPNGNDTSHNKYMIKGKNATKEEYDAYLDELIGGLTPLEWHEFTEENIDKYVVD